MVLICADFDRAINAYQTILAVEPTCTVDETAQISMARFQLGNTALEIISPLNLKPNHRIIELLDGREAKLTSLAFSTDDFQADHHLFARRGLNPSEITPNQSFRLDDTACYGVKTFIVRVDAKAQISQADAGAVSGLDHIVINTPNPTRAIAHYGGKLGLGLRLDRTIKALKTRFLFFKTGGVILELIHRLDQGDTEPNELDNIWGLTWAVDNLEAAHARLLQHGLALSEIRKGRKPGSRVFTVKDGTLGIPTLFITHEERSKKAL